MSRTIAAGMVTMLAGTAHTRCNMLLLDLKDGTTIGVTDHDNDLDFDIGDGVETYLAGTGIFTSDVALSAGLDTDNYEVSGPIAVVVTKAAVLGGRFNYARARLFQVNWKSLAHGAIRILAGNVTNARVEGGRFVFEIRSDIDRFNQVVGRLMTPYCEGDHATCCVNIGDETATTVTAVASTREFTVAAALTDNHVPGRLWFTSGDLTGTEPVEIYARTGDTVKLFIDLAEAPEIGDALVVKEGCDRTRAMCLDRFNNVIEFRGYPEVPGSDQVFRMPVPGGGDDQ